MRSRLAALVAVLLIALVPIRGLASQVALLCQDAGHGESAVQSQVHAGHAGHGEHDDPHASDDGTHGAGHGCGFCTKHCSSASVALPPLSTGFALAAPFAAIPFDETPVAGHVPDHPDRPPLAS